MRKTKTKTKGLLGRLIEIYHEQALRSKALRMMSRQEWSVDFLSLLVAKAAKYYNGPIELELISPAGQKLIIRARDGGEKLNDDQSIFNRLDDEAAVRDFIERHGI